jgi:hypothetical protein
MTLGNSTHGCENTVKWQQNISIRLLGYNAVCTCRQMLKFRKNILPPSSGLCLIKHNAMKAYGEWRYLKAKAWGGRSYSSYSFSTSALDGGEWSASRPGRALAQGKGPPVPIVQEVGWAPEPVWIQTLQEKSFASVWYRTSIALSSSP